MTLPIDPSTLSSGIAQIALESRFKESMFRRFEPLMTIAIQRAPAETEFEVPRGISINTFTARFRDSFLSLKRYEWNRTAQGTTIPMDKLRALDGRFGLYPNYSTNTVWFRAKNLDKSHHKIESAWRAGAAAPNQPSAPWVDATETEVQALCLLLHFRRLTGPYLIAHPLPPTLITSLFATFDVSIVWDEEKHATIIT